MAREIKFRAWGKNIKEYLSQDGVEPHRFTLKDISEGCIYDLDLFVIEQYTGHKDRNGKEICEGDIVLDCYDGDDAFIVEWDKDTASFRLTGTDNIASVSFDNFYSDKDLEIIGNIHENPELLKPWNAAELEGNR